MTFLILKQTSRKFNRPTETYPLLTLVEVDLILQRIPFSLQSQTNSSDDCQLEQESGLEPYTNTVIRYR